MSVFVLTPSVNGLRWKWGKVCIGLGQLQWKSFFLLHLDCYFAGITGTEISIRYFGQRTYERNNRLGMSDQEQ